MKSEHNAAAFLTATLSTGKVPHALVFTENENNAGFISAMCYAKALLCSHTTAALSCGTCRTCTSFEAGTNGDITVIGGDGTIGVAKIRALISDASTVPVSRKKVYVINDAHNMTREAQNALLKLFEEPPSYLVIILIARDIHAILPTLASRAIHLYFPRPPQGGLGNNFSGRSGRGPDGVGRCSDEAVRSPDGVGRGPDEADASSPSSEDDAAAIAEALFSAVTTQNRYDLARLAPRMARKQDGGSRFLDCCDEISAVARDILALKSGGRANSPSEKAVIFAKLLSTRLCFDIIELTSYYYDRAENRASPHLCAVSLVNDIWKRLG